MIVGNGGAGQLLIGASVRPDQTLPWNVLLVFAIAAGFLKPEDKLPDYKPLIDNSYVK